ncbi:MAG: hypothetical protein ACYDB9_03485 [Gammaproteobacteria bacterium]
MHPILFTQVAPEKTLPFDLKFLRQIERETPQDQALPLIADHYAPPKHPAGQEWLAQPPRFRLHFTPTSGSGLNMVERLCRDITAQRLRRRGFTSVPELIDAIEMSTSSITTPNPSPSSGRKALATSCRRSSAPTAA